MKMIQSQNPTRAAIFAGAAVLMVLTPQTQAQLMGDVLINKLEQKGILSVDEAREIRAEAAAEQTNLVNSTLLTTKFKLADSIKNMQFYGDLRMRYEYRGVDNPTPGELSATGASGRAYAMERFRYALRFGIRGDLYDNFSYGLRLETSANPRSPWSTFGKNTSSGSVTPSDKSQSSIGIGQAFLNWHPAAWYEMTVGRMAQPLYTTPMVWDSDINPEGAFEKFKYTIGNVDLFADFGQFVYQDPGPASQFPSTDTMLLAWQAGANVRLSKDMFVKIAPVLYTYSGTGTSGGLNSAFVGQGQSGLNVGVPGGANVGGYNQQGINGLLVLEIPAEFDFKIWHTPVGTLQARLFGDFAYNFYGADRANTAYQSNPAAFPGKRGPEGGQNKAYQIGFGVGSDGPTYGPTQGLVYGSTSKKNTWEARVYWQHIEQYALDVNMIDSDFFEGRGNLQGIYSAFAYSFTDAIIGTIRYGYASQINRSLGTGGNNLDIPGINPINDYNIFQADLTWRF